MLNLIENIHHIFKSKSQHQELIIFLFVRKTKDLKMEMNIHFPEY